LHSIKPIGDSKKAGIGENDFGEIESQVYPTIVVSDTGKNEALGTPELGNQPESKAFGGNTEPVGHLSVSGGTPAGGLPAAGQIRPLASGTLPAEAEQLIGKLARLDDAWETGILDAEVYQTQRALWKTQLIDLISAITEAEVHRTNE
jgi:hypothetical protein